MTGEVFDVSINLPRQVYKKIWNKTNITKLVYFLKGISNATMQYTGDTARVVTSTDIR